VFEAGVTQLGLPWSSYIWCSAANTRNV
jgi:hypothetical protein